MFWLFCLLGWPVKYWCFAPTFIVKFEVLKTETEAKASVNMAQLADEPTNEGQVETRFDLKQHLSEFNVSDAVYKLLVQESITFGELVTYTSDDLKDWCNEHNIKTSERRRFINAVKSLPNAEASKPSAIQKEKMVFVGKEEKEQMNEFDEMETSVNKTIADIRDTDKKSKMNVDQVIKDINDVCDQIQTFVENLRKKLIEKVSAWCIVFCLLFLFCFFISFFRCLHVFSNVSFAFCVFFVAVVFCC